MATEKKTRRLESPTLVALTDQVAIVKRQIMLLEATKDRRVRELEITEEKAHNDIQRWNAVLDTLLASRRLGTFTPPAPYALEQQQGGADGRS